MIWCSSSSNNQDLRGLRNSPGRCVNEQQPLSPDSVPLNLSRNSIPLEQDSRTSMNANPNLRIIRNIAHQELWSMHLSGVSNWTMMADAGVSFDHDYNRIVSESTLTLTGGNCSGTTGLYYNSQQYEGSTLRARESCNSLRSTEDRRRSRSGSTTGSRTSSARTSLRSFKKDMAAQYESSSVIEAETSIIATFIAKVKQSKRRKSFGTTYHVIKPRAHLYLPNKKVVQERYDVTPEEIDISDESVERDFRGGSQKPPESLQVVEHFFDEQIQHQHHLSGRWESLFQKIHEDGRLIPDESAGGITAMTQVITEKNKAISKSLENCKLMLGLICSHKQHMIDSSKYWKV